MELIAVMALAMIGAQAVSGICGIVRPGPDILPQECVTFVNFDRKSS